MCEELRSGRSCSGMRGADAEVASPASLEEEEHAAGVEDEMPTSGAGGVGG